MYKVLRVYKGDSTVVMSGIPTEAFALQMVETLRARDTQRGVRYVVEVHHTDPASGPRQRTGKRKKGPRGGRSLSREQKRDRTKRRPLELKVWGLKDRNGDISLATRAEDELGLGIPAQWGKGRRHRKGEYIP